MIQLVPMTEAELPKFLDIAERRYAEENITSGRWQPEDALRLSQEAHKKLLPEGIYTPDQYLCMIVDEAQGLSVGFLWFSINHQGTQPTAFVFQFEIYKQYRRHHYGTQAFLALEEKARQLGINSIGLHVFSANTAAKALYDQLGYVVTSVNMTKKL